MAEDKKPDPTAPGSLDYSEWLRESVVPGKRQPTRDDNVRIYEVTNTHKTPLPPDPKDK